MSSSQSNDQRPASNAARQVRRGAAGRPRQRLIGIIGTAVIGAVAVAVVLILLNSREGGGGSATIDVDTFRTPIAEIDGAVARDGRTLGDPAAPILVVEYADYQCPFCTGFGLTGLPRLLDDYVATGQVRLEYRHLVVIGSDDPNGESFRAAEAAECARDQGRFWEMHELLVANSLGEFQGSFTPDRLKDIAELDDGLDQAAFGSCVDERTHRAAVVQMRADAVEAGITRTPTFVVDGQPVSGGYLELKPFIDERLAAS